MALWWQPGDDTAGLVSRSERVVRTMRDLLGDEAQELYLLSSKLIAKEPEEGGAFAWHQVKKAARVNHLQLRYMVCCALLGLFGFIPSLCCLHRTTDIFTRTVFCSRIAALSSWACTRATGKPRYKSQYPASPHKT